MAGLLRKQHLIICFVVPTLEVARMIKPSNAQAIVEESLQAIE